jgi:hypothetical protein
VTGGAVVAGKVTLAVVPVVTGVVLDVVTGTAVVVMVVAGVAVVEASSVVADAVVVTGASIQPY